MFQKTSVESHKLDAFQYNIIMPATCDTGVTKMQHGYLFTPQPSGLEGYCRRGPGGRAGGRAVGRAAARLAEPISL